MKKQASSECMKVLLQSSQVFMLTFEGCVFPSPGHLTILLYLVQIGHYTLY